MASGSDSRDGRAPKRPRFTFQVPFKTFEEKDAFVRRFESVCKLLTPPWSATTGQPWSDVRHVGCGGAQRAELFPAWFPRWTVAKFFCATVVRNRLLLLLACLSKWYSGVYVGDEHPEDQAMFVSEKCCFTDLVNGLLFSLSVWADHETMAARVSYPS